MDFSGLLKVNGHPGRELMRGDLLLAEPLLKEQVFSRAAILVLDVDTSGGVMGLSLNKKLNHSLSDIIDGWDAGKRIPLFCGGPVDTSRLFMLHSLGERFPGSQEILPGIYVGGRIEDIVAYIEDGGVVDGKIRFFLGYSGWGDKQLKEELAANVWAVSRIDDDNSIDILRGDGNAFWRREIERLGGSYRSWLLVPEDPSMN